MVANISDQSEGSSKLRNDSISCISSPSSNERFQVSSEPWQICSSDPLLTASSPESPRISLKSPKALKKIVSRARASSTTKELKNSNPSFNAKTSSTTSTTSTTSTVKGKQKRAKSIDSKPTVIPTKVPTNLVQSDPPKTIKTLKVENVQDQDKFNVGDSGSTLDDGSSISFESSRESESVQSIELAGFEEYSHISEDTTEMNTHAHEQAL